MTQELGQQMTHFISFRNQTTSRVGGQARGVAAPGRHPVAALHKNQRDLGDPPGSPAAAHCHAPVGQDGACLYLLAGNAAPALRAPAANAAALLSDRGTPGMEVCCPAGTAVFCCSA